MIQAAVQLQQFEGNDTIIDAIGDKIAKIFEPIKDKDFTKTIDDIIYYSNGLIEDKKTGDKLIIKSWTPVSKVKSDDKASISITKTYDFTFISDNKTHKNGDYVRYKPIEQSLIALQMTRLANKASKRKLSCAMTSYGCTQTTLVSLLKQLQSADLMLKENAAYELFEKKIPNNYYAMNYRNYAFYTHLRGCDQLLRILNDPLNTTSNGMFGYIKDDICLQGIEVYKQLNGPNIITTNEYGRCYDENAADTITIDAIKKVIFQPNNYVETSLPMSIVRDTAIMFDNFTNCGRKEKPSISDLQYFVSNLITIYNALKEIPKNTMVYKILVCSGIIDPEYTPEYKYILTKEVEIIDSENINTVEYREIS